MPVSQRRLSKTNMLHVTIQCNDSGMCLVLQQQHKQFELQSVTDALQELDHLLEYDSEESERYWFSSNLDWNIATVRDQVKHALPDWEHNVNEDVLSQFGGVEEFCFSLKHKM